MKTKLTILVILISIVSFAQNTPTTNLQVQSSSDKKAWVEWDETNPIIDPATEDTTIEKFKIRYKIVSSVNWFTKTKYYDYNQYPHTRTRLNNLTPNTLYEFKIKSFFRDGTNSGWSFSSYLTTGVSCTNVANLYVNQINQTKATFNWNNTNGSYLFVRLKARIDTTNAVWFNIGGSGIEYGINSKTKYGLAPGTWYRVKARTWCGVTPGLPYKSGSWSSLIFFTQPVHSARLSQENNITLVRVTDLLGRECKITSNKILIYLYSDGSVDKKMIRE